MLRDSSTTTESATDRASGRLGPAPIAWDAPEWPVDDNPDVARASCPCRGPQGLEARATPARRHREVLVVTGIVAVLAFALVEVPGGRVAFRGLREYPVPQTCLSRSLFGLNCPGCGLTRSIIHLAEGDWGASWRCHRLGGLMAAVLIFQVPYRLLALRWPDRPLIPTRWQSPLGLALIALLLVNWLADVVAGRLASL
jgi:Protein of unknown function (DUF2752)